MVLGSDGQLARQRKDLDDPIAQTLCSTRLTGADNPKFGSWATESLGIVQYHGHRNLETLLFITSMGKGETVFGL